MNFDATADDPLDHPDPVPGRALVPLLIGSAVAMVLLLGQSRLGAWLRGFLTAGNPHLRASLREQLGEAVGRLPSLRGRLLGRRKAEIASTFGPPRTAVLSGAVSGPAPVGQRAFWRADTWYYAIDSVDRTAMAIRFDRDIAIDVSFFSTPQA